MIELKIGGNTKRSRFATQTVSVPDFETLPEASRAFIQSYGLRQYIADGMAGAESEADAKAGIEARVANILAGEFKRTRGDGGDKLDSVDQRAMKLAKALIRTNLKAANQTAEKDAVNDAATKLLAMEDNPIAKKLKADAKKQVEMEAASREAAVADSGDLLTSLGLTFREAGWYVMAGGESLERAFDSNATGFASEEEAQAEADRRNEAERAAGRDEDAVLWFPVNGAAMADAIEK